MSFPLLHPRDPRPHPLTISPDAFLEEFREDEHTEFKRGAGFKPIAESMAAFANHEGGLVFVGIDDRGRPSGPAAGPGLQDKIHEIARSVVPQPRYEIETLLVGDSTITVVVVWMLAEGVASLTDGRVLRRRGTRDEPLVGPALQALVVERATTAHQVERAATAVHASAAAPELIRELTEARGWTDWRARRLAERQGLVADEYLTTLGVLLLTARPDEHLGRVEIDVVRYPGDDGDLYDLRRTFHGPVHHLIPEVDAYVSEQLGFDFAIAGSRRVELPKLPRGVLREALANAIAHRSYERLGSCVSVEMRPGSVRVVSPGGLPAGVEIGRLREEQVSRNPELGANLRHMRLAEQRGRGIDLIEDELTAAMLGSPRYEDNGREFAMTLPLNATVSAEERAWIRVLVQQEKLQPSDPVVFVHAIREDHLTNGRVQAILGCDERRARGSLQRLVEAGLLERSGERAATRYRVAAIPGARLAGGFAHTDLRAVALGIARDHGVVTNRSLRESTGADRGEALRVLTALVDEGELMRTGERRGVSYQPAR